MIWDLDYRDPVLWQAMLLTVALALLVLGVHKGRK